MNELLTPAEMSEADKLAGNAEALMQSAGWAVARAVMQHYAPCKTLIMTGPGHNGGDGRIAGAILSQSGWPVKIRPHTEATQAETARADLVIDAVFGAGLSRDISPELAEALSAARRLVAIDVPSGLDGATGQVRGFAPQAEFTITFFRAKPGHYLYPGRALCGELLLCDIGLPESVLPTLAPQTWLNSPRLWTLPPRPATLHKYTSGDVTVLSGTLPGAARLACAAARRTGAGMVTLAADTPLILPESGLIVRTDPMRTLLQDTRRQVWVCGPGLGPSAAQKLAQLIAAHRTIVADADALITPDSLRGATVITPHAGEFTRLFGPIPSDKLTAARSAAKTTGAVTVLKGADTIIASPDGRAAINANAPPWLATGGTGDILSGIIAALLAQGMKPFEAACAAVFLHGQAAQKAGPGLLAEDLPAHLGPLLAALRP
jgi:hydroxyethylthiazole kinase-like uncharacterized protein yjeF